MFNDPVSSTNIAYGEILINARQVTSGACYIHWDAIGNRISLRDDADQSWLGPVAPGGDGTLANTQCVLSPASAVVTGSGAGATLSLNVAFTNLFAGGPGFSGGKMAVFMQEQSAASAVGWTQAGTWQGAFAFTPVSVTPGAGSGNSQVFTFVLDGLYAGDSINLVLTTSTAFGTMQFFDNACGIAMFDPTSTQVALFGDVSINEIDGNLGTGPPLRNSQCALDTTNSSAVLWGTTLTLRLAFAFDPSFIGQKDIYVFGPGSGYSNGASLASIGTFTVTPATPMPQTITFPLLSDTTVGVPPFTITATSSSGLPVAFVSNDSAACAISDATVTIIGAGTCSITASQPGNADYSAATPVTQSFAIKATIPRIITRRR